MNIKIPKELSKRRKTQKYIVYIYKYLCLYMYMHTEISVKEIILKEG